MDIGIHFSARQPDEVLEVGRPHLLHYGPNETRLAWLNDAEADDFRQLIEFWNSFPAEKLEEIRESLEYVRDVGPMNLDSIADGDEYDPHWSTSGDDLAGMCHHLRNLFQIFEIKDGIERWTAYAEKADTYKTTKERDWIPL